MIQAVCPFAVRAGDSPEGQRGFTLIELVVVMAILGLLAAMAYPSVIRHQQAALRTDAHAGLMQAAAELERCYSRTFTYHECTITPESPAKRYTLAPSSITPHYYLINAASTQKDGCAAAITLDSRGERLPKACW
ncbi:type IV pilus assembly protein PilE [Vreelandella songnenensis]|uniref:Type IV pilus assembly protein PilE n=1 Tax=Vreelandella songnenensis TaxID=1176243 RepID=A0A2T0V294_9GAMM|nr:type IV pilin protein [Halomonas songnenensis]PRY64271.1 type IV pilus assembly protein PilE [Halomonas songnenensis]